MGYEEDRVAALVWQRRCPEGGFTHEGEFCHVTRALHWPDIVEDGFLRPGVETGRLGLSWMGMGAPDHRHFVWLAKGPLRPMRGLRPYPLIVIYFPVGALRGLGGQVLGHNGLTIPCGSIDDIARKWRVIREVKVRGAIPLDRRASVWQVTRERKDPNDYWSFRDIYRRIEVNDRQS